MQADEDFIEKLKILGNAAGEAILADDIETCHRVPVARGPSDKNIVVQFVRRAKRNSVLVKGQRTRLTKRDLRFCTQVPVYVKEHLGPKLKKLLR